MKQITVKLLRALVVSLALEVSTAFAQGTGYSSLTITNPLPSVEWFGTSVAAMGSDRVLVGASGNDTGENNAGAAYLFNTAGALLTTFTNPTPEFGDEFGTSVATVGNDWVLIGDPYDNTGADEAGAAYLFSTNGALLTILTNPTPTYLDRFGQSVAGAGSNLMLIGAYKDDTGADDAGVAYLFSTSGALVTVFTNPTPASFDYFGCSVAAMGNDRVLIGAIYDDTGGVDSGSVYLFSTNGTLLTVFTNPAPAAEDWFGYSVTAFGTDRVVIGAWGDHTPSTGSVYLFNTNGTLLTTFSNPKLTIEANFGYSVAAVGSDSVLIGSYLDKAGVDYAGVAYLFSTNGTLLKTFTAPTPTYYGYFGYSVASVGRNVLIGAYLDHNAGAVYLFTPVGTTSGSASLSICLTTTNTVAVSWPSPSAGWTLQENVNGVSSVNWSNAPGPIQDDGTNKTLIVNPPTGNRFYRLFKP